MSVFALQIVRFLLLVLLVGASGCRSLVAGRNAGQALEPANVTSSSVDSASRSLLVQVGGQMLLDSAYQQRLIATCKSANQDLLSGGKRWVKYQDCSEFFVVAGTPLSQYSLLLDDGNEAVIGVSYLTLDSEVLKVLDANFSHGVVRRLGRFCAKYGRNQLPVFSLVRASACDGLHYGL